MKARLPMPIKQKAMIREEIRRELDRQEQQRIRRVYKLLCVVLHELYGFGAGRLAAVLDRLSSLSAEHDTDEIFWEHIDRVVIRELGIPFEEELECAKNRGKT